MCPTHFCTAVTRCRLKNQRNASEWGDFGVDEKMVWSSKFFEWPSPVHNFRRVCFQPRRDQSVYFVKDNRTGQGLPRLSSANNIHSNRLWASVHLRPFKYHLKTRYEPAFPQESETKRYQVDLTKNQPIKTWINNVGHEHATGQQLQ